MVVASFAVSAVALVASGFTAWYVKKQAEEARRSAEVAESAEQRAELIEQRRRFGWRIEAVDGHGLFILRNTGWKDAKSVQIASEMVVGLQRDVKEVDLAAGQGISILAFPKVENSALDIYVSWAVEGDESRHTWTEPLPSRPPLWTGTQAMRALGAASEI
jgi:hypothetical protein